MSTGPGNRLFPESPENVSGMQLPSVAYHPIFGRPQQAGSAVVIQPTDRRGGHGDDNEERVICTRSRCLDGKHGGCRLGGRSVDELVRTGGIFRLVPTGAGVEQPNAGEIREPMETGEVPDRSVDSSDLHSNASVDEPTVEIGGQSYRPSIDFP